MVCAGGLTAWGESPSLCLSNPTGCDQPGSTINVEVMLGAGDPIVVGSQFVLMFDPAALTPLEILPGQSCDPLSPISLEIYKKVDAANGSIFFATGINPFKGESGTQGPATIACVRFLPSGTPMTEICIMAGDEEETTRLSDNSGHVAPIDNSTACPTDQVGAISCRDVIFKPECRCTSDAECDSFNGPCRIGVCNESVMLCEVMPINEGGACNDGNDCTTTDVCVQGECEGSGCTNPSLCLDELSTPPGNVMAVPVKLGAGDPFITGAQFTMQWNPAGLNLYSVQPGSWSDPASPFMVEIQNVSDAASGELFYAVGVAPGVVGTQGPATLAWVFFEVQDRALADVCLFEDSYPFLTKLVDDQARLVDSYNEGSCSSDQGPPFLDCQQFVLAEIPTTSDWGLVVLTLAFLVGAKLQFRRGNNTAAAGV